MVSRQNNANANFKLSLSAFSFINIYISKPILKDNIYIYCNKSRLNSNKTVFDLLSIAFIFTFVRKVLILV